MENNSLINNKIENEKPNEIIEIDENEEITATQYDLPVAEDKLKKPKKRGGHSGLSRNGKIMIIIVLTILLVIGIALIIYFLIIKDKSKNEEFIPIEEDVIVEKDNYNFKNGKLIFKDNDESIGEYECKNNNDVLCYVAFYSNEDEFDVTEKVYESGIKVQNRTSIYKKNFVFVYDNEKKEDGNIVLYDIKNKKVINEYKLVKEITDDKAIVKDVDNQYHVILFDDETKEVIKSTYDYIGYIADSKYLVVADNNNYKLIDLSGENVSKEVPGKIMNFDDNNISVLIDKSKYVYNYNGEKTIEKGYDYIRFVNDYIIGALSKKLYVYDLDGSPMNIDGIKISSNKYNTKLIYGSDLKQTGREIAFDAFVTSGNMRIEFGEDYELINLYEGAFSKTLNYANYLNGKLYFYSDQDKTNLLGTYTCKNANVIKEDTNNLDNCFVALEDNILNTENDTKSYIPIYNKRYVFIKDVDSTNRGNIVLYDLVNNEKKVEYLKVDVGNHKSNNGITFVDTAGTLFVAQNTSEYYGVLNISSNNVSKVIDFRYQKNNEDEIKYNIEIKKLDNYYLIKRNDKTYHLYDTKGKELTSGLTTSNEIVKLFDKYVKVKSGNKYLIYNLDGTITSSEYKYIYMTDLVYVVINDEGKIEAYKYDDKSTNLVSDDIIPDNEDVTASVKGSIMTINYYSGGTKLYQEINIDEVNIDEVNIDETDNGEEDE